MLKTPRIVPSKGKINAVISGNASGIQIQCSTSALPAYTAMVKSAAAGNYWASLAVSGIVGLSSGHSHMNNIYKPKSTALSSKRSDCYFAILPGVRVVYQQQNNGAFTIISIKVDSTYVALQNEFKNPGLWRAKKVGVDGWAAKFVQDGELDSTEEDRFVVVSDKTTKDPDIAAKIIFDALSYSRDKTTIRQINRKGFDIHFTPGEGSIGGMSNLREIRHANTSASLIESAHILAQTMYKARNIEGVVWGAEEGGSGILTQAMQILADRGVELKTHGIFFNRATTAVSVAVPLARKLGIDTSDVDKKAGFGLDQLAGQLCYLDTPISNFERLENDDNYTAKNMASDIISSGYENLSLASTMGTAAGLVGITFGAPIVAVTGSLLAMTSLVIKAVNNTNPGLLK